MERRSCLFLIPVSFILLILAASTHSRHFEFSKSDQSKPCILMDTKFSIHITATEKQGGVQYINLHSEDEFISITGSCGNNTAILNLVFSEKIQWSFWFKTDEKNSVVQLNRFIQFVPKDLFPFLTDVSDHVIFDHPNTANLSQNIHCYSCDVIPTRKYKPEEEIKGRTKFAVTVRMKRFKVQAFNVINGTYSPEETCSLIISTLSTTPGTTVTPPDPGLNFYYVTNGDKTCIALQAKLQLDISYPIKKYTKENSASFLIPENASYFGNCSLSGVTQNIVIDFFDGLWSLEIVFRKEPQKRHPNSDVTVFRPFGAEPNGENIDYQIDQLVLKYTITDEHFPGASNIGDNVTVSVIGEELAGLAHKPVRAGFYSCHNRISLDLDDNTTLTSSDLQLKAFNNNNDRNFEGTSSKCSVDELTGNDDYVIGTGVVACVIGLAVVVVFVVLFLLRRRRQTGYHDMT